MLPPWRVVGGLLSSEALHHSSVISRGLSMITSRSLCRGVDLADSVRALRSKATASEAVRVSSERSSPFWSSSGKLLRSVASRVPVLPCTMWIPSGPLSSMGGLWRKRRLPWPGLWSPGSSSSSVWISCKRWDNLMDTETTEGCA